MLVVRVHSEEPFLLAAKFGASLANAKTPLGDLQGPCSAYPVFQEVQLPILASRFSSSGIHQVVRREAVEFAKAYL